MPTMRWQDTFTDMADRVIKKGSPDVVAAKAHIETLRFVEASKMLHVWVSRINTPEGVTMKSEDARALQLTLDNMQASNPREPAATAGHAMSFAMRGYGMGPGR